MLNAYRTGYGIMHMNYNWETAMYVLEIQRDLLWKIRVWLINGIEHVLWCIIL